ncbi:MAG: helix-turn-helix transcriptional regulator [Firmicutes bacterium]|nr:helix-turn-helix transcriptional regulator [Bacillota bacterium]
MDYKGLVRELLTQCTSEQRKKWGLTQEQMAELLHISSRAYGNAERGKSCISSQTLVSLLGRMDEDDILELLLVFNQRVDELGDDMPI